METIETAIKDSQLEGDEGLGAGRRTKDMGRGGDLQTQTHLAWLLLLSNLTAVVE